MRYKFIVYMIAIVVKHHEYKTCHILAESFPFLTNVIVNAASYTGNAVMYVRKNKEISLVLTSL